MINPDAIEMMSRLEGLPIWGPLVGPWGMTLQFGSRQVVRGDLEEGEFTSWARCEIKLSGEGIVYFPRVLPAEPDQGKLSVLIMNSSVIKAAVDEKDTSLRLLLGENKLLSVYPSPTTLENCWLLFDHTRKPTVRCIATAKSIEVIPEK